MTRRADRMRDIQPFHVMEVLARAKALERAGRDIIHLEIGAPDFETPAPVVEAGRAALASGKTHYTEALGIPELRQAISNHYPESARPAAERIAVVPGSSAALQLVFAVLLNPGDQVLLADPGYPCNANFARLYGGEPVLVPCPADTHYQLSADSIREHWSEQTRAVLVASPSNPSGTLIPPDEMSRIATAVRELGGTLIVDEIYHGLVYDADYRSALHDGNDIFVINSFSKYYGMTGWRLGWLVAPDPYVDDINRLCQNLYISAPTPAQYAALEAFTPEVTADLDQRRDEFQRRRDYLLPALRELGFKIPLTPEGAFYIYADIRALGDDSDAFAQRLLDEAGVAITPGQDFGRWGRANHVRFSYANKLQRIKQAVTRMADLLRG